MARGLILSLCYLLITLCASAQLTEQQQVQKLHYAYQNIRNHYVDDVPLEPLVEEAIRATLAELDPHSKYLSREEMARLRTRLRGEFGGIGIRYIMHNDTAVVRTTLDHSPAERAGIRPNDRIVAIDNRSLVGLSTDSIATLLRGDKGSRLRLGIVRRGEEQMLDIELRRDNIESSAISAAFRIGEVGYIATTAFSNPMTAEFLAAYRGLGKVSSLVVDMRNNGGGAITAAIELTSLFLHSGEIIVSTEGRSKQQIYDTKRDGALCDIPLVVLINESSASASEIFAGAIQDYDRGVIVGHTSYGKGLVQRVIDLKDGSGITLTVARYKTPSGRIIQRPYRMGGGEEYAKDRGRYQHPDSVAHDESLLFKTLKHGRRVYGGGGITPDLYINSDSIVLSEAVARGLSRAGFEHVVIDFWERSSLETLRAKYPTVEEFNASYSLDEQLVDSFCRFAECRRESLSTIDQSFIRTMLLATMAEQLYDSNARSYIYSTRFDYMVRRAVEIAANSEEISTTLGAISNN